MARTMANEPGMDAREARSTLRRRGVIAAAAAVIAGLAVKETADPERVAADGATWTMPYNSGIQTTSTTLMYLNNNGTGGALGCRSNSSTLGATTWNTTSTTCYAVGGFNGAEGVSNNYGVYGQGGYGKGVYGTATTGTGVYGAATLANGYGVIGTATTAAGVYGYSGSNYGVIGTTGAQPASGNNLVGAVTGYGNGANTAGVVGRDPGAGYGVYGRSGAGVGVFGVSDGGANAPYGVLGVVNAASGVGVFGVASVAGAVGVFGSAAAGATAAVFSGPVGVYGNVFIQGNYTATGTKSAAVSYPDGSHRLMYCMESPEAWFEDFGEGTLAGGKGEVKLDPAFAAVVDTGNLHVFLTPHDETHHLAVKARAGGGFSVAAGVSGEAAARGAKASDASGTFTWRVVAKRQDVKAERLAKFDPPPEIKTLPVVVPSAGEKPSLKDLTPPPALPPEPKH